MKDTPKANLKDLLVGLEAGQTLGSGRLQLIPVTRTDGRAVPVEYVLATEAFKRQTLHVTEVSEHGVVGQLLAVSETDLPVLFIDGEELLGAKQNRILNTDVLLRPRTKVTIPVSCVEQGRWHDVSARFDSGGTSPAMMRARKSRSVSRNLRERRRADSDQAEVWEEVADLHACMGTASPTAAMADAFAQRQSDLDALVSNLTCPTGAVGVVAAIRGRFAALDVFDQPTTLERLWSRLVRGYAADALGSRRADGSGGMGAEGVLDRAAQLTCQVFPGVDLGQDWRFESADLVGSALVVDDVALHMSAFPVGPEGEAGRIGSPSQRRRNRRS